MITMTMRKITMLKAITGIGMIPCVIYVLNLVLTVAPCFLILYAGLFLYGIFSRPANDNR